MTLDKKKALIPLKFMDLNESLSGLATMSPDKVAKIAEKMVEIDRASNTGGRTNTQTTNQLMTLTMMTDSPYRRLRQCLSQIEDRRMALEENYFRLRKNELEMKGWLEAGDELSLINLQESEYMRERSKIYIDGAVKEIAVFQEAYEEIRRNNNIPENWDEMDAERDEIKHHIRQVFRQAHRDMILTGSITQGNAEYFEQYGIHLQVAKRYIEEYIKASEKAMDEGHVPNVKHLYGFLDRMVDTFKDAHQDVVNHIGLDKLLRGEFLYREDKHGKEGESE